MSHDNVSYQNSSSESIEDSYWAMVEPCAKVHIPRSRMGQLAKLCGDFQRAKVILTEALKTRSPSAYLGRVTANLRAEQAPSSVISKDRSKEPEVVLQARLRGWPVRKSFRGNGTPAWWVAGVLYDQGGVDVGG